MNADIRFSDLIPYKGLWNYLYRTTQSSENVNSEEEKIIGRRFSLIALYNAVITMYPFLILKIKSLEHLVR